MYASTLSDVRRLRLAAPETPIPQSALFTLPSGGVPPRRLPTGLLPEPGGESSRTEAAMADVIRLPVSVAETVMAPIGAADEP